MKIAIIGRLGLLYDYYFSFGTYYLAIRALEAVSIRGEDHELILSLLVRERGVLFQFQYNSYRVYRKHDIFKSSSILVTRNKRPVTQQITTPQNNS